MAGKRKDPQMRFWPKVDFYGPPAKNNPELGCCWDWIGNFGSGPYGLFGLVLDHFACDRKSCVNPDHLHPVTYQINALRSTSVAAIHASRTHCPKGHPYDDVNTYRRPDGKGRGCLTCRRS